ncbi:c-type cytochrome [Pseudomonas marginalis]|uniref:Cytochrome c-551 n=1 Tax=Pseudomonas petroselini TaxID=2899822 RepID=A0ABS8QTN0_9PSED|nr:MULTISPECIES: c-type cytochrome [Pseudomonas fluorescens group]MCD7039084.1 c-type cytochrome [Pseudomonas petroselini]MCD7047371.1 c-type cytochrome [Pseudomonas petroselini]MCD7071058.1 c-type cytochrome [Pseudomonas petroselini]MCD7082034.1 c-type cytochrome [Pseudomonas petroselini]MCF5668970.1 c-type cytochrome [Pseudomonas marginalis]
MKNILLALLAAAAALSLQPVLAQDGPALFKSKPCAACHAIDSKLVGPALKDVAAKNAGVKDAAATLAGHIKNGTQGNWGPIPMPPNPVTDDEAKVLADWVLSLK